jgi:hypothetical protein
MPSHNKVQEHSYTMLAVPGCAEACRQALLQLKLLCVARAGGECCAVLWLAKHCVLGC